MRPEPACRFKEGSVEGEPIKGLLEVLAETALTGASAPGHLGEVEPSCMSEKKLMNRLFLAMPK